jgi:hypothetical protein
MTTVVAGVALLIPAVASATTCVTAHSDRAPTTGDTNAYAVGWVNNDPTGNYDFVNANINVRDPVLAPNVSGSVNCTAQKCGSYAWIMMVGSGGSTYAQYGPFSGWYVRNGTIIGPGADYTECGNTSTGTYYDKYVTTSTVGTSPYYTIHYGQDPDGNSNNKIFKKGGTIEDWCGGDGSTGPFTFTPVQAQGAEEIHDISTQLPGSRSNHETFRAAIVTDPSSGTTDLFGRGGLSYTNGPLAWMGEDQLPVHTNFDFWDNYCS